MKRAYIKKKNSKKKTTPGFTIVELLIVIVIIAILASITVVAYNGIQQTSNNTVRASAASQYIKLIKIYLQQNGNTLLAPDTHNCLNEVMAIDHDNDGQRECGFINKTVNDGKATYDQSVITKLQQTSPKLPESPPAMVGEYDEFHGPSLSYYPGWLLNGQPAPYVLMYLLEGEYKSCGTGLKPVIWLDDTNLAYTNQPYSETGDGWNETACYLLIEV